MAAPVRRNVSLGTFATLESGASVASQMTITASQPFMSWGDGNVYLSQPMVVTANAGVEIVVPLIPTNLSGWTLNGSIVDVSGGKQSHTYKITVKGLDGSTQVGRDITYNNVVVPNGSGTIDLDLVASYTGVTGDQVLVPSGAVGMNLLPPGTTISVFYNSGWPPRPTGRSDISVRWIGGTVGTPPTEALTGVDVWDRPAA
jgi:hypothetical protein